MVFYNFRESLLKPKFWVLLIATSRQILLYIRFIFISMAMEALAIVILLKLEAGFVQRMTYSTLKS